MKKSEFESKRREFWGRQRIGHAIWGAETPDEILAARDTAAADAAGVAWDPEEEPMAERLWAVDVCGVPGFAGDQWVLAVCRDFVRERLATKAEATLAADLYNRREAIEEVAAKLADLTERSHFHGLFAGTFRAWANRLRGK